MTTTSSSNYSTVLIGNSAYCYTQIFDDNWDINWENVGTNTLNVLDYIPVISWISAIARIAFANYKKRQIPSENTSAKQHYKNHIGRAWMTLIPLIGNAALLILDIANTSYFICVRIKKAWDEYQTSKENVFI